ncbi:hypothetical protein C8Q80DRAFT_782071 [Daedaleopsis nitida]|nr:hypothetical protein C8Q80DRAFT_782071 [Daedaleopsis nitida]
MAKLTILSAVALACAVAVQGASLGGNATFVAREKGCEDHDPAEPKCETTGGSPLVSDCVEALKWLGSSTCYQGNSERSWCTTRVTFGTCKIDACGDESAEMAPGIHCGGYLQTILNDCQFGGRIGGYLIPQKCNVRVPGRVEGSGNYKLQFSHS